MSHRMLLPGGEYAYLPPRAHLTYLNVKSITLDGWLLHDEWLRRPRVCEAFAFDCNGPPNMAEACEL